MKNLYIICSYIVIIFFTASLAHAQSYIPRTVIALYDKHDEGKIVYSRMHRMAEMPLNHLGIKLEYHDVAEPLPNIKDRKDVRGIISWFPDGFALKDPAGYIKWADDAIDAGKKFLILAEPGFLQDDKSNPTDYDKINNLFGRLGLKYDGTWIDITYDVKYIYIDPEIMGYERKLEDKKTSYSSYLLADNSAKSYLIAQKENSNLEPSHLITSNPRGCFVAYGFTHYQRKKDLKGSKSYEEEVADTDIEKEIREWYINPFEFFRRCLDTDQIPKPDTTTQDGRRIFYSHIDGDGWNNITQLEIFKNKPILSAKVILEQILKKFPDLPVTVAPIAADLDKDWVGHVDSVKILQDMAKLPNVEIGSHTYSHPFSWEFFQDGNIAKERRYLNLYPNKTWGWAILNS